MKNLQLLLIAILAVSLLFTGCGEEDSTNQSDKIEYGTVTDIDGNVYKTVKICDQRWMAENLNVSCYRNGDSIPHVTDENQWDTLTTGGWCYYINETANGTIYGKLYNWYTVNDTRALAPAGWHVASNIEWKTLTNYLGGESFAGSKMKEAGTIHWKCPNKDATNESGLTALPGGFRDGSGAFGELGYYGSWWTSTKESISDQWSRGLSCYYAGIDRSSGNSKEHGFSVRCIKDK